jgi:hypothetical protein
MNELLHVVFGVIRGISQRFQYTAMLIKNETPPKIPKLTKNDEKGKQ